MNVSEQTHASGAPPPPGKACTVLLGERFFDGWHGLHAKVTISKYSLVGAVPGVKQPGRHGTTANISAPAKHRDATNNNSERIGGTFIIILGCRRTFLVGR